MLQIHRYPGLKKTDVVQMTSLELAALMMINQVALLQNLVSNSRKSLFFLIDVVFQY